MVLWLIVGFIVWILCVLFMLAFFKVGYGTDNYMDIYKNNIKSMANTQKIEDSLKKDEKKATRIKKIKIAI